MSSRIEYRILSPDNLQEAKEFLMHHFVGAEPITKHLNIQKEDYWSGFGYLVEAGLAHNVSIGAYDESTGKMCGMVLNILGEEQQPTQSGSNDQPLNVRQMTMTLQEARGGDLFSVAETSNYLYLFVMAIENDFQLQGVANELGKWTVEIAKQQGCSSLISECTSAYTLHGATENGFSIKNSILYKDYVDPITGEKIYQNLVGPHTVCAAVFKKVDN